MKIYFATWILEKSQGETLSKKKAFSRLMSFFHISQKPVSDFVSYIEEGK